MRFEKITLSAEVEGGVKSFSVIIEGSVISLFNWKEIPSDLQPSLIQKSQIKIHSKFRNIHSFTLLQF